MELNYRAINEGNRFVVVTPEETVDLVEKQENKNTQVQTASHIRLAAKGERIIWLGTTEFNNVWGSQVMIKILEHVLK